MSPKTIQDIEVRYFSCSELSTVNATNTHTHKDTHDTYDDLLAGVNEPNDEINIPWIFVGYEHAHTRSTMLRKKKHSPFFCPKWLVSIV